MPLPEAAVPASEMLVPFAEAMAPAGVVIRIETGAEGPGVGALRVTVTDFEAVCPVASKTVTVRMFEPVAIGIPVTDQDPEFAGAMCPAEP
jgi:hypothetical protein